MAGGGGGEERMPPPNIATGAQRVASVPGSSAHCVTVRDKTPLSRHLSRSAPPTPRLLNMSAPLCLVSCVFQTELHAFIQCATKYLNILSLSAVMMKSLSGADEDSWELSPAGSHPLMNRTGLNLSFVTF